MKATNCDTEPPLEGLADPLGIALIVPDLYSKLLLAFCITYLRRWLSLSASKSVATSNTDTSASSPSLLSKFPGSFLYKQKFLFEFELGDVWFEVMRGLRNISNTLLLLVLFIFYTLTNNINTNSYYTI
jgi:hypothetical protein